MCFSNHSFFKVHIDKIMYISALILCSLVLIQSYAQKIPWCIETSNPGVIRFGPLSASLKYSQRIYKQFLARDPVPNYQLQGILDRYVVEYLDYTDIYGTTRSYFILFIKDKDVYRIVDYLEVNTNLWKDFERAIIDADYQPNQDFTIRIKFVQSDCNCVMRVYDLTAKDIPSTATSEPCSNAPQMNNPYHLEKIDTHFSNPLKFFIFDEFTKYPACKEGDSIVVHKEFGPLHPHLLDNSYFSHHPAATPLKLSGDLTKYKVDFTEYREVSPVGTGVYGYVALSYDFRGLNLFQTSSDPEYKVVDYLRVKRSSWQDIQQAILEGTVSASTNWRLRVKYLTEDCRCVMRVYDLRQQDIPGSAETRACNGHILPPIPHKLEGAVHQISPPAPQTPLRSSDKYSECNPNNDGVLNEFGPLPKDLSLGDHYRQNIYTTISNKQFQLEGTLKGFNVEYKEFEDKYSVGTKTYAFIILKYNDGLKNTLLDYIRVNPLRWQEIENAIVAVKNQADGKIILQFLISDCSCVAREYNLKIEEFYFRGKTVSCVSPLGALPPRKTTQLTNIHV